MKDTFRYKCSRRARPMRFPSDGACDRMASVELSGAGSGGGPEEGSPTHYHDGTYALVANQVQIHCVPPMPPVEMVPYIISLFAGGMGTDGRVEVAGSQGVRVTAGPPMLPPASAESTNGVEVVVGELQNITIQRGLIPEVDQQITMKPGAILVDGGIGTVTIQSLTEIKLQVAEGLSSITLTPAGIVIQGLLVAIN